MHSLLNFAQIDVTKLRANMRALTSTTDPGSAPMDESRIRTQLEYVGITQVDIDALRAFRPFVEEHADRFVKHFYDHLLNFEGTRAFLTQKAEVQRLLAGQRNYVLSVFDAKFDAKYYEFRRKIGHTHFRIGLNFQWYIGAYVLYLDYFLPLFSDHLASDPTQVRATTSAFRRAILLDMSIVLEAYHEGDKAALEDTQAQLIHQEKLAAVGLLASGLAHEIGNPLASIQAICDNQLRKCADPAVAERFQRIRDQVERITGIVRQLVGFARPVPSTIKPVKLRESIESSLVIAKLSRGGKTANIDIKIEDNLPEPEGVPDQISQVFLNLFINALDALPEFGGQISVNARCAGDKIAVSIRDTGSGIKPENMSKLFTPFFTTKDVGKGTGLGLHVCKGIIQRHGGEIQAHSEPGCWSEFTILLPLHRTPGRNV